MLRSIRTQSEFCRQTARAAPGGERVSGFLGLQDKRGFLRMSLHEEGIVVDVGEYELLWSLAVSRFNPT